MKEISQAVKEVIRFVALLLACFASTFTPTALALGSPVGETVYIGYDATVVYDGTENSSSAYEDAARPPTVEEKHAFGAARTFLSQIADLVAAESSGVIKYSARAGGEMGVGSQAALDEAIQSPALQNVTLRTQPVYNPTLSSFGRSYAGGYDNYWSQIGNKAFSNDAELVGTIVHEETHLRVFERQLSGGARASALDAAAEEAYVRQVEGRFLRMKGY